MGSLSVPNLWTFFREKQQLEFSGGRGGRGFWPSASGGSQIEGPDVFSGAAVAAAGRGLCRTRGHVGALCPAGDSWTGAAGRATRCSFSNSARRRIRARSRGRSPWRGAPQANYVVWLEGFDLDPQALAGSGQPFFGQLAGRMNGSLRVLGASEYVSLLSLNLTLNQGRILPGLAGQISLTGGGRGRGPAPR